MKAIDLTGKRFGRLTVIRRVESSKGGQVMFLCKCDCGQEKVIQSRNLRGGNTRSCGCIAREAVKRRNAESGRRHGGCGTRLYRIWNNMRERCTNSNSVNWHLYGGRGISVCGEWMRSFEAFRDWALSNGYGDELQLDRIDNNGDYKPDNCRWATCKEQGNNRRTCIYVTIGNETKSVSDWCAETGVSRSVAYKRIHGGWDAESAVTTRDESIGKENAARAKYRPVVVDGVTFESRKAAAAYIGVSPHSISRAVRNGGTLKGHTIGCI